jgi:hypothetical protein
MLIVILVDKVVFVKANSIVEIEGYISYKLNMCFSLRRMVSKTDNN